MKTVYLHIGTSKTGSSAIQAFLEDNQELLKEKGYCYQVMPFKHISRANVRRNAHFMLEKVMTEKGELDEEQTRVRIQKGYQIIEVWLQQYDNVILTDENFWNGMRAENWSILEQFKGFLEEREVELKIIVYFRKQEDYMISWWKQMVRVGKLCQDWESFVNHPKKISLNYYKKLKIYEGYVGKGNLIVRRFEKTSFQGEQGTIFSDFMNAIGLELTNEYVVRERKVNESLTENFAEIKRNLNAILAHEACPDTSMGNTFEKVALACSRMTDTDKKYSMLSKEEQKKIWKKFEKSNQELAKNYFGIEENLFELKESTLEKWTPNNETMLSDIVTYFGMLAIKQQQENEELKAQIKDLRQMVEVQDQQITKLCDRIEYLECAYKNNKGELKALKVILAPIKWTWRKLHDLLVKGK